MPRHCPAEHDAHATVPGFGDLEHGLLRRQQPAGLGLGLVTWLLGQGGRGQLPWCGRDHFRSPDDDAGVWTTTSDGGGMQRSHSLLAQGGDLSNDSVGFRVGWKLRNAVASHRRGAIAGVGLFHWAVVIC